METSVHEPALDRPAAELVAVRELELSEHGRDVRLDGLRRDRELEGDLLVEVAAGDEAQDLALAQGELVELGVGLGLGDLAGERVEDEAGEARREDGVAVADAGDGVGQLRARRSSSSRSRARPRARPRSRPRRRPRPRARGSAAPAPSRRPADHLDSAAARHVDVEQDDVGLRLRDQAHRLLDRAGVAQDLDEALELRADARAKERVVVDDDDEETSSVP